MSGKSRVRLLERETHQCRKESLQLMQHFLEHAHQPEQISGVYVDIPATVPAKKSSNGLMVEEAIPRYFVYSVQTVKDTPFSSSGLDMTTQCR